MNVTVVTRSGKVAVIENFKKLTFWYNGDLKEYSTDFSAYLDYGRVTLNFIGDSQLSINSSDVEYFKVETSK